MFSVCVCVFVEPMLCTMAHTGHLLFKVPVFDIFLVNVIGQVTGEGQRSRSQGTNFLLGMITANCGERKVCLCWGVFIRH